MNKAILLALIGFCSVIVVSGLPIPGVEFGYNGIGFTKPGLDPHGFGGNGGEPRGHGYRGSSYGVPLRGYDLQNDFGLEEGHGAPLKDHFVPLEGHNFGYGSGYGFSNDFSFEKRHDGFGRFGRKGF
ncbi:UNVERIFIED_CONTAM: hypothetical protein RMT77_019594 [Armadillidium vulgare]